MMHSLDTFSSYMPSGWGRPLPYRTIRHMARPPAAPHGFSLERFWSLAIDDLAEDSPAFADRRSNTTSSRVEKGVTAGSFLIRLSKSARQAESKFFIEKGVRVGSGVTKYSRNLDIIPDAAPVLHATSVPGVTSPNKLLANQPVFGVNSTEAASATFSSAATRAGLTARSSDALGPHGSERVALFQKLKEDWDNEEGRELNIESLHGLNKFFDLRSAPETAYSVFLARSGNLSLGWRDERGAYVEVEFISSQSMEYFVESSEEEGVTELTEEALEEILRVEVLS